MGANSSGEMGPMGPAAIMVLYFFSLGFAIVTPAMAKFAEAFPGQEYALINSLPTLFIGFAGLILGAVAGRRVGYRTLAIAGSALSLFAGLGPAFTSDFFLVIFCRALLGIGMGLTIPLANALVSGLYEGEKRSKMLAMGSVMLNIGGVLLQYIGGVLADIDWHATFYAYGLFAVSLIMAFFIPEPPAPETSGNGKIDRRVFLICALFAMYGMLQFSVMQNTSELFAVRGAGGASVSGLALSIFTVFGCIGGLLYAPVSTKCTRAVLPLLWTFSALGTLMFAVFTDGLLMTVALAVFGLGFGMIIPAMMEWTGKVSTVASLAIATSVVTASMYFGDFLSVGWKIVADAIFGEHMVSNLWTMAVFSMAMVIVFAIYNPFKSGSETE